jgi:(hydroxyamino)benzene mutase
MEQNRQSEQSNKLIFWGLALLLLGLAVGLFVQNMTNPRMALSAHLEGLMNGMFLMLLGLIWQRLVLSAKLLKLTFLLAIYGTFANLLAVIIAAITGFGKMMPIAGGKEGTGALQHNVYHGRNRRGTARTDCQAVRRAAHTRVLGQRPIPALSICEGCGNKTWDCAGVPADLLPQPKPD